MIKTNCPVCCSSGSLYSSDRMRSYLLCSKCHLVYVPRDQLLSCEEERKRYLNHENNPDDYRYRIYIGSMVDAILPLLKPQSRGLDFGCGEGRMMEKIFNEKGFKVDSFDLYFYPELPIWEKQYDFIVLSEVIEHLKEPGNEMTQLKKLLNPGGIFFIKTMYRPQSAAEFQEWFYKRDPTHIQFFDHHSMTYLSEMLELNPPVVTGSKDMIYMMD